MSSIPDSIIEKFKSAFRPFMSAPSEAEATSVTSAEVARHPLQDDIDALATKVAKDITQGTFTANEVAAKLDERRQVLNLQYRQALAAHRKGGGKKEQDTVTSVLSTLTARYKELEEDIGRMAALAKGPARSAPATGMLAKELGKDYVGESKTSGWREGKRPEGQLASAVYDIRRKSVLSKLTADWNDKQRSDHEVTFDGNGSMHVDQGHTSQFDSYAIDPDTGKMYLFKSGSEQVRALSDDEKDALKNNLAEVNAIDEKLREDLASKDIDRKVLEGAARLAKLNEEMASLSEIEKEESSNILFLENKLKESQNDPFFTADMVSDAISKSRSKLVEARKSSEEFTREGEELVKRIKAAEAQGVDLKEALSTLNYIEATRVRFENAIALGTVSIYEHHSTPLEGGKVGGAGELKFTNGKLEEISNISGHYKPQFVQLAQTIEYLMREGATQQSTLSYIDDSGKSDEVDYHDKLKKLHHELKERLPELPVLKGEAEELQKRLDGIPEDLDHEARMFVATDMQNELDAILKKIEPLEQAVVLLRKFGVGPSNKPSGTKVEFMDDIQSKTGLEIHQAKGKQTSLPTAEEFLQSGGGHKVYDPATKGYTDKTVKDAKDEVLDSLKSKTADTRKKLDHEAKQRAKDLLAELEKHMSAEAYQKFLEDNRAPTDEDLKRVLAALRGETQAQPKLTKLGERLEARLKELGVKSLDAAKLKLGIDGEDWGWMNSDVLRAKVVLGDMSVQQAVEQGQNDPNGELVTDRLETTGSEDATRNGSGESVAQGPEYDESAIEKKLEELGAKSLEDAWRKLGLDREDWAMMNRDKWRAKVILGELSSRDAVDLGQQGLFEGNDNDVSLPDDESGSRRGRASGLGDADDDFSDDDSSDDDLSDDDLSDDDEPDNQPEYDEQALEQKLEELGAKGLKDAWRKLHLDDEDWAMMNTDKWRAKVILGELSAKDAVDKSQEELSKF